jgi:hypothetical protein
MNNKKLKIGLIVDSTTVSKYVYDLAEWANSEENIEVSHLIIQNISKPNQSASTLSKSIRYLKNKGLRNFLQAIVWRFIIEVEKRKLKKNSHYADHLQQRALPSHLDEIIVTPDISKSGFVYRYKSEDIEKIRSKNIDLLIRCGSGILLGEILSVCSFGVISFHHGDNKVNRGGPAGFWEVFYKESRTGFVIQRLNDELDGGDVLFRGYFPTLNYYMLNQANLYTRSNYYLKELIKSLAISSKLPEPEQSLPYSHQLYRVPTVAIQLKYFFQLASSAILGKAKDKIFRFRGRWGVAFQRRNWRNLVMWKSTKVANPPGRFLADPFVISKNGVDYCFVEDYDFSTERGCISVVKLDDFGAQSIERVIIEPFHMSFPFLFEYQNNLLMVPETSEKKDIRVYECVSFPCQWKLKAVLMSGVSAADSMIFHKDGLWWLFTNIDPLGASDHCSELSIFYSLNPVGNAWTAHPMNPIYIDPSKARNGGILFDGKQIFRVAQRQGFDQYGVESAIYQIDNLDKEYYSESLLNEIKPIFFNAKGTHHLHSNEAITVFDYLVHERP